MFKVLVLALNEKLHPQKEESLTARNICSDVGSTFCFGFCSRPTGLYPADRPVGLNPGERPVGVKPVERAGAGRRRNLREVTRSP